MRRERCKELFRNLCSRKNKNLKLDSCQDHIVPITLSSPRSTWLLPACPKAVELTSVGNWTSTRIKIRCKIVRSLVFIFVIFRRGCYGGRERAIIKDGKVKTWTYSHFQLRLVLICNNCPIQNIMTYPYP